MTFPERLAILQKDRNLSKQQVIVGTGISRTAFYRYENGDREPTMTILIALADFFDVSLDYLVGRCDNPSSHKQ